jgi:hypothetical protein
VPPADDGDSRARHQQFQRQPAATSWPAAAGRRRPRRPWPSGGNPVRPRRTPCSEAVRPGPAPTRQPSRPPWPRAQRAPLIAYESRTSAGTGGPAHTACSGAGRNSHAGPFDVTERVFGAPRRAAFLAGEPCDGGGDLVAELFEKVSESSRAHRDRRLACARYPSLPGRQGTVAYVTSRSSPTRSPLAI